jgi:ribonuclease HI
MIIHFGDNEVYSLKGMNEAGKHEPLYDGDSEWDKQHNDEVKNSIWETESQSLPRFCEVMVRWFKEHKKIPDTVTWHEMIESIVGYCFHEG